MERPEWKPLLERTCELALEFFDRLPERNVAPAHAPKDALAAFSGPVPEAGSEPRAVIEALVERAQPGLCAMPSGRFFGWVIGGGLPAAVAADWLTTVWDQNCGSAEGTPAAAAAELVAVRLVGELLALPATSGVLVTGGQMANFVGLAAARSAVLHQAGWDLEGDGLTGAPPVRIVVGAERHGTIDKALRMLGFGHRRLVVVEVDREGRMRADQLAAELAARDVPTIVCAQAGNVNGGAFDPMPAIADAVDAARRRAPAWLHLDGAFGLWARVSSRRQRLAADAERADSWATDAHKWLNTPYDCGIVMTRHADAHRRAMSGAAAYLPDSDAEVPSPFDYAPELSRRARGFALWAALRQLGKSGVAGLVDRTCDLAERLAAGLAAIPGVEVMNEVALNQLVVRFRDPAGVDHDGHTRAVAARVLADGSCYPSPTVWRGVAALRFSLSNWSTDAGDVTRTLDAIGRAHRGG